MELKNIDIEEGQTIGWHGNDATIVLVDEENKSVVIDVLGEQFDVELTELVEQNPDLLLEEE